MDEYTAMKIHDEDVNIPTYHIFFKIGDDLALVLPTSGVHKVGLMRLSAACSNYPVDCFGELAYLSD